MTNPLFWLSLLLWVTHGVDENKSCSAANSFVKISSLPHTYLNGTTLLSSHALFAPYSYYIASTQLVILDANMDDICDSEGISTNISKKVLLLFESVSTVNCTIQDKVFTAQENQASAVLMANNYHNGKVVNIIDEFAFSESLDIPTRSITFEDGEELLSQIQLGNAISAEFGCFDTEYSATLCLSDSTGDYWYADGEYQRIADMEVNGHPVWMKEGIPLSIAKLYIYLRSDFMWAITYDPFFIYDEDIRLKCNVTVHDPSLCPFWIGIIDPYEEFIGRTLTKQSHFCEHFARRWHCEDSVETLTFEYEAGINVSANLCPITENIFCIQSDTLLLSPFMGQYYQYNEAQTIWIRETNECDQKAGALLFDGFGWVLLDALNRQYIASCFMELSVFEDASAEFNPSLCTQWKSIQDDSLNFDENKWNFNEAFSITKGECAVTDTCVSEAAPDAICMTGNSLLNSILSGTFIKTNVTGPEYGSPEYKRTEPLIDDDGEELGLYIWYRNEVISTLYTPQYEDHPDYRSWFIVDESLTSMLVPYEERSSKTIGSPRARIFGMCDGFAFGNPINCKHWTFKSLYYDYVLDDKVTMSGISADSVSECPDNIGPSEPDEWPQYICVALKDEAFESGGTRSTINSHFFVGGYAWNGSISSKDNDYRWVKKVNDDWDFNVYIDYDIDDGTWELEGVWNTSEWTGNHRDRRGRRRFYQKMKYDFKCDAWKHDTLNPVLCETWYDEDYELLDNMYLYECTNDDMITKSPTTAPTVSPITSSPTTSSPTTPLPTSDLTDSPFMMGCTIEKQNNTGLIVLCVILSILVVVLCVIGVCAYLKYKEHDTRGLQVQDGDEIEKEMRQNENARFDMSPLNVEDTTN